MTTSKGPKKPDPSKGPREFPHWPDGPFGRADGLLGESGLTIEEALEQLAEERAALEEFKTSRGIPSRGKTRSRNDDGKD